MWSQIFYRVASFDIGSCKDVFVKRSQKKEISKQFGGFQGQNYPPYQISETIMNKERVQKKKHYHYPHPHPPYPCWQIL